MGLRDNSEQKEISGVEKGIARTDQDIFRALECFGMNEGQCRQK